MKAAVYTEYGSPDVLQLQERAKPTPKDNEVLIQVYATSVNFGDTMARNFKAVSPREFTMPLPLWLPSRLMFGLTKPRVQVLGSEFAGKVEAVGKAVTRFGPGDEVFGYRGPSMGANAEYLCMAETGLVAAKPANLTYEEAAAIPYGALTALSLLRKVAVQRGQKVLIIGASGAIGSAAVQLARHYGAEVTGVCGTPRLEYVKALGAKRVIDYTSEDFAASGETYDLIVDVLGKSSFAHVRPVLASDGRYLRVSFKMKHLFQMLWTALRGGRKMVCALSAEKLDDLIYIKELAEARTLTAIIDRCFPLEQAAAAHRYFEAGHKKGSVVITMARSA